MDGRSGATAIIVLLSCLVACAHPFEKREPLGGTAASAGARCDARGFLRDDPLGKRAPGRGLDDEIMALGHLLGLLREACAGEADHSVAALAPREAVAAWDLALGSLDEALSASPAASVPELIRARATLDLELELDEGAWRLPSSTAGRVRSRLALIDQLIERDALVPSKPKEALTSRDPSLRWPLNEVVVRSPFGWRVDPLDGHRRFHYGVDLRAPEGSTVAAAGQGAVAWADWNGGHGKHVELTHPDGFRTRYSHLSAILVAHGQQVEPGDPVGLVGSTGRSTGPHLHFEVWRDTRALDPKEAIARFLMEPVRPEMTLDEAAELADGTGLFVPAGRVLTLDGQTLRFDEGRPGILVEGELVAHRVSILGGAPALRIEAGEARLEQVAFSDAEAGVELTGGGSLSGGRLSFERIDGPAIFVSRGSAHLEHVLARGVHYGLLGRPEAEIDVRALTVTDPLWAGVALVGGRARLVELTIEGASRHGAIMASDASAPLELRDVRLSDVGPVGIALTRAHAVVAGLTIEGVSAARGGADGMCVLLDAADVEARDVSISGCAGEGVAVLGGHARLGPGSVSALGEAAVQAWRGAVIEAAELVVEGGAFGAAATDGSRVTLRGGALRGSREGAAVAECESGAEIIIERDVEVYGPIGGCVTRAER